MKRLSKFKTEALIGLGIALGIICMIGIKAALAWYILNTLCGFTLTFKQVIGLLLVYLVVSSEVKVKFNDNK